MAEETHQERTQSLSVIDDLRRLVWGVQTSPEIFDRWSQGFVFSDDEPTALVQDEGGPCAVIAPVQAFLLKNAFEQNADENWRHPTNERRNDLLASAMLDIIRQCASTSSVVKLVFLNDNVDRSSSLPTTIVHEEIDDTIGSTSVSYNETEKNENESEETRFHSRLRILEVDTGGNDNLGQIVKDKFDFFTDAFGVIFFLYSVVLTKGVDQVKNEIEDPNEPLIDPTHGHGSQSLINLLITGRAVSNVWDNDKDVSGLKLRGINNQPVVGFLTLLEHLRYCEVGWFLKCPANPIWVLASETHLTVTFSKETKLCTPETSEAAARRIFKSFDPEGNNFISSVLLDDVMKMLGLFSDPEYVEMMKRKLDSEELGVILLNNFMEEFYPDEQLDQPDSFKLFHYNGLNRSNPAHKVIYRQGNATLVDFEVKLYSENTPILTCLQTKWPGLQVEWIGNTVNTVPSLN